MIHHQCRSRPRATPAMMIRAVYEAAVRKIGAATSLVITHEPLKMETTVTETGSLTRGSMAGMIRQIPRLDNKVLGQLPSGGATHCNGPIRQLASGVVSVV
jgi:hypothetical protein